MTLLEALFYTNLTNGMLQLMFYSLNHGSGSYESKKGLKDHTQKKNASYWEEELGETRRNRRHKSD